jgi:integration host factor subunit alpha
MTKAELVEKIYERLGLTKRECYNLVESVFDIMKESLIEGENLKISSFGSFIVKEKKARKGRNPQTNETITISERKVIAFRPSKILRNEINQK